MRLKVPIRALTQWSRTLFQIANGRWPQGFELELYGSERFQANSIGSTARHLVVRDNRRAIAPGPPNAAP